MVLYGFCARLAQAKQHTLWFDIWPVHTLWVCWIVAIMVLPMLLGKLPHYWLVPRRPSANTGSPTTPVGTIG
jgi:hypothetical protein